MQETVDLLRDWEDSEEGMGYPQMISAAGKEDLGGGVEVGITATLQNAQLYFAARSVPIDSANLCTTASGGEVLVSSTSTFIADGLVRGDMVFNSTTAGMATILTVDSETQATHLPLSGGSRDDWQVGDSITTYNQAQCSVSGGNLVAVDDVGADIPPILESPNVQVVRTASSSATTANQSQLEFGTFSGQVAVAPSAANAVSGTTYPAGTLQAPSNNMTDALLIAANNGLSTLFLLESMTITEDLSGGLTIRGASPFYLLTASPAADLTGVAIENLTVQGELDGLNVLRECSLLDVTDVSGFVFQCALSGDIDVIGDTTFMQCYSNASGNNFVQIHVPTGALIVRDYSGSLAIGEITAGDHSVGLKGGRLIVQNTCTGGNLHARDQPYEIVDSSVGAGFLVDQTDSYKTSEAWRRLALDKDNPLTSKSDGGISATDIDIQAAASGSDIIQTRQ